MIKLLLFLRTQAQGRDLRKKMGDPCNIDQNTGKLLIDVEHRTDDAIGRERAHVC